MRVDEHKPLMQLALELAKKRRLYAIVRLQDKKTDRISITNGITQSKQRSHIQGIGIMVFTKQGACAFGSTDVLSDEQIKQLVDTLHKTVRASHNYPIERNKEIFSLKPSRAKEIVPMQEAFDKHSLAQKEQKLLRLHKYVQQQDKRMSVSSSYAQSDEHWWIARSDGTSVKYTMPYGRIAHTMTKHGKHSTQSLFTILPGIDSTILSEKHGLALLRHRVRKTVTLLNGLLKAKPLPAGNYTALLTSGFSGLLAHEAVGHASESDLVRNSVLGTKGKLKKGVQVCASNINFVDGPMAHAWGDVRYSANGIKRKTVTFIKEGVLVDSLSDVFTARSIGANINGCGRSEYFYDPSIPRMSNTRVLDTNPIAEPVDPDYTTNVQLFHLLRKLGKLSKDQKVVLPVCPMGGEVSPEAGTFMFNCAGIYVFEYPKKITLYGASSFGGSILEAIKTPMRGIGTTLDVSDVGMCGKGGQGAPVTDGSHPFLLVDKTEAITFGGQ